MPLHRWMDKHIAIPYNVILLTDKQEQTVPQYEWVLKCGTKRQVRRSLKYTLSCDITDMWNPIFKNDTNELIYKTEADAQI